MPLLKFVDATALLFAAFGQGTGPIHLDDLFCQGYEDFLVNCTYDSNTADCSHFEDAGVRCQRKKWSLYTFNLNVYLGFILIMQLVLMEKFVLREEVHSMRDVWRFVETSSGVQFVTIVGPMLMPQ